MCSRKKWLSCIVCLSLFFCLMLGMAPGIAAAVEADFPFRDVPDTHWAYDAIRFVFQGGLMRGTSPVTFAPGETLSRAMVATILYRMAEEPPIEFRPVFNDVAAGQWYSEAIVWAYDNQIVFGVGSGCFAPDEPVTREALVTMLYRYAEFADIDTGITASPYPPYATLEQFADRLTVSGWAEDAMRWAVGAGLISGKANWTLAPSDTATRAECATILMRLTCTAIPVRFGVIGSTGYFFQDYYDTHGVVHHSQAVTHLARSREDMVNILSKENWWSSDWKLDEKYDNTYFAEHCIIMVPHLAPFNVDQVLLEGDRLVVYSTRTGFPPPANALTYKLIEVDNTHLRNVRLVRFRYIPFAYGDSQN